MKRSGGLGPHIKFGGKIWDKVQPSLKSVQSALSDLKRPLNVYSPSAIIGFSLLNSILMARFLKQSFAQTCLKETDNGKLHQFNY